MDRKAARMVIPGHGRLCDFGDVINFREMATIIRDRVQDMIKKGMTLEQVKAASRRRITTRCMVRPPASGPPTSSSKRFIRA